MSSPTCGAPFPPSPPTAPSLAPRGSLPAPSDPAFRRVRADRRPREKAAVGDGGGGSAGPAVLQRRGSRGAWSGTCGGVGGGRITRRARLRRDANQPLQALPGRVERRGQGQAAMKPAAAPRGGGEGQGRGTSFTTARRRRPVYVREPGKIVRARQRPARFRFLPSPSLPLPPHNPSPPSSFSSSNLARARTGARARLPPPLPARARASASASEVGR